MAAAAEPRVFEANLEYLLQEKSVCDALRVHLLRENITTMHKFANLDDTKAEVRRMIREEWDFTTTTHAEARSEVAAFIDAWESAAKRLSQESTDENLARSSRLPAPLVEGELQLLKTAFEAAYWKLEKDEVPSEAIIEHRTHYFTTRVHKTEFLSKVTNEKDGGKE
jgi:hypothetical protein